MLSGTLLPQPELMLLRCFKRISCVGMGMHSVDRFGFQSLGLWELHWEQGSDAAPLGVSPSIPKFGWGYLLPPGFALWAGDT